MIFVRICLAMFVLCSVVSAETPRYNLFSSSLVTSKGDTTGNRLLVITEPSWCQWCRVLDRHLERLKREGYDVYTYSQDEWRRSKNKPGNMPKVPSGIPFVMYVKVSDGVNKVVYHHGGGNDKTVAYIKRHLTK